MLLLEGIAALVAKVASASTVVQATAGLGIAVVGVTGVGAAGGLPGPLQDGVAHAVESVSPLDLPDSTDETRDPGTDGPGDVPGADPTDVATPTSSPSATETSHSEEPGDDGGTHQNLGGTAVPIPAASTDNSAPGSANSGRDHAEDDGPAAVPSTSAPDSAEVEDHEDGHTDGNGGGGDDSGGDHSDDDSSGHGGGDDH